jgi:hypothetical protein
MMLSSQCGVQRCIRWMLIYSVMEKHAGLAQMEAWKYMHLGINEAINHTAV